MFIFEISALFTNIDLFIYVSNVYFRNFGFVYKHWFVYIQIFGLFTNIGLFIYVSNVYFRNFGFVYKHWIVYLRFKCLFTKFRLCLQTLICLFTFSVFIFEISALFINIGLFIYIFCVCLHPECRQTCRRYVARFLDICFLRWLKMRWKNDGRGIESRLKERKCIFTMAYRMVDFNLLT
jgi:hypothetical protein